jgi:hypothetical protein
LWQFFLALFFPSRQSIHPNDFSPVREAQKSWSLTLGTLPVVV